jgi:polyhydroxyalkanoate synthesis regulator phasin
VTVAACWLAAVAPSRAAGEEIDELRNTVINVLRALVERGVLSREQAESLVRDAQSKAAADREAAAASDEGAVRVPFVPEIVREQLEADLATSLTPVVADAVVERAKVERWGVPGALPEWLGRVAWSGDIRVRAESQIQASGNLPGFYLDFQAINEAGGIGLAGPDALRNVTEDRNRLRVRARFGLDAGLGEHFNTGVRIATGEIDSPVSTQQTAGDSARRYSIALDRAFLRFRDEDRFGFEYLTVTGGKFASPFLASEMLFDPDLAFDGVAGTGRLPIGTRMPGGSAAFWTLAALPLEEIELSGDDKVLLATQLGVDMRIAEGHRFRAAAAYYDFRNVQGRRNAPESTLLDFTAPGFLQGGNTLFDIRNDLDVNTNLFALAGQYEIVSLRVAYDLPIAGRYAFSASGEWVRNIGWEREDVLEVSGIDADERVDGYEVQFAFGLRDLDRPWNWRASAFYRYVQRDAILDAFSDSDFRGGGTDVKGYGISAEVGVTEAVSARLRYYAADEIDGPPFGLDTLFLDVNARY